MDATKFFPSKWLNAGDLEGRTVKVRTVPGDPVEIRDVGNEQKPVLALLGFEKGLVLNQTNTDTLIDAFGIETKNWGDKEFELFPKKVRVGNERKDAIRINVPNQIPQANKQESQPTNQTTQEPETPATGASPSLIDEVIKEQEGGE